MSSPRVGVVRKSMLTNPLIIKAPVGQTRSILSVPGPEPGFTFGTSSSPIRDGGTAEALSSWSVQSKRPDSARPLAPDFVYLNREAVKSGLVTSKELSQYRAQRGKARKQNPVPPKQKGGASQSLAVSDITFGVKTCREPSPLSDLLSHQYARRWLDEQRSRNQTGNHNQLQRIKPGRIPDTRTSLLRRSRPLPVTQTPFKLPCFTQVAPALDTFRDPEARLRAFKTPRSQKQVGGVGEPSVGGPGEGPHAN